MPAPRTEWSPDFAKHVKGWYDARTFDEDGLPEEQKWGAECTTCHATHQGVCMSGQVRQHITKFALVHLHRDPLSAPTVVGKGSRRVAGE